jgi:FixJ family two-component response regulator
VAVGSYEELVALGEEALKYRGAILDVNLGPGRRSGIDASAWLRQKGYTGRIAFLTGHARDHPLVVEAHRLDNVETFTKPIDPDQVRSLVEEKAQ